MSGRVRVTGSTPFEQVLIEPADSPDAVLEVYGDYRAELRRLAGAHVRASGSISGERRLRVTSYAILEIAGQVPLVGLLEIREAGAALRTTAGERVDLRSLPAELRERAGAKVWVILDSTGAVKGYGIIRER